MSSTVPVDGALKDGGGRHLWDLLDHTLFKLFLMLITLDGSDPLVSPTYLHVKIRRSGDCE